MSPRTPAASCRETLRLWFGAMKSASEFDMALCDVTYATSS